MKSTGLAGGVSQIDLESGEFCGLHKEIGITKLVTNEMEVVITVEVKSEIL